jgi:hypothetical protein
MNPQVWYCVRIPSVDMQSGRHIAIKDEFETVFRELRGQHNADVRRYRRELMLT